jgi:hypothetical protein
MNIAHATISGTMKVPKARGIGMTTGCKAAGVKLRLWHRIDNRCCCARSFCTRANGAPLPDARWLSAQRSGKAYEKQEWKQKEKRRDDEPAYRRLIMQYSSKNAERRLNATR